MSEIFNCYYVNYTAVDCVQIIKRVLIYCHQSDSYFIDKLGLCRTVGETGARSYRGRLLQGHFMQNYHIDGEIADSSSLLIHQGNY